jgi:xylulokinase
MGEEARITKLSRKSKIMQLKDYLAYRLRGVFVTDVSVASGTLSFDVQKGYWSQPMLEVLGIREELLPELRS